MTFNEAFAYVEESKKRGSVLDLSNMLSLMEELGNPQNQIPTIHIAGTNGKGSCAEMITNVLINAGYKVGKFISPHLIRFNDGEGKCVLNESVRDMDVYIMTDVGNYDITYRTQRGTHHMVADEHYQDIKKEHPRRLLASWMFLKLYYDKVSISLQMF